MGCKGNCGRAKDEDDYVDMLSDGTYFKLDQYGDIIGVTSITTEIFSEGALCNDDDLDDEDEFFTADIFGAVDDEDGLNESDFFGNSEGKYLVTSDGFTVGVKVDKKPQAVVDVDYVAEMLQGLEPQELKYISKLCEVLIAEGEL